MTAPDRRPDYVAGLIWQLHAVAPKRAAHALREHHFHPHRRFRFDLAFLPEKVAVEVNGGAYIGGRHTSGPGFEKDCEKYSEAAALGWRIIHATPRQVESGECLGWLERALA